MSQPNLPPERRAVLSAHHEPPQDLPVITYASQGCVMAHWRGVGIVAWATQATGTHADEMGRLAEEVGKSHPRGSSVNLVINRAPLPTHEARRAIHEVTRRYEKNIVCAATVIEGAGFWASAIRSLVTSLHLVGRWSFDLKTFSEIDTLSEWLAPIHSRTVGTIVEAKDLAGALAWVLSQPAIQELCARRS